MAGLPDGAAVVDLGCGAGVPTTARLAERFAVTGVDISAEQLLRARRLVPGARFVHADMTAFDPGEASVDGVVACYSLTHLPAGHQPAIGAPWRTAVQVWPRVIGRRPTRSLAAFR